MIKNITISCYVAALIAAFFISLTPPADAVSYLRQGTATTVLVGPFVDVTDGVTAETGITPGSQCDLIKGVTKSDLTLGDGDPDTNNDMLHVANGYYSVELTTGNTDTLGPLILTFTDASVFVPVWKEFVVVTANVYDTMFSTDKLEVDAVQWNGTAVATPATAGYPAVTIKDGTGTGEIDTASGSVRIVDGTGTGEIDTASGAVVSVTTAATCTNATTCGTCTALGETARTAIADAVWNETLASHTTDGTFGGDFPDVDGLDDAPANFSDMAITATTGLVSVGTLANNVITSASIVDGGITNADLADDIDVDVNTIEGSDATTYIEGRTLAAASYFDPAADTVATVTTCATCTNLTNAPTNGDLTATMKASVNAEVDTALNTAIPGSPTADSINERVAAIDNKLPTNYIMGSSVLTAKDDEIDDILTDTGTTLDTKINTIDDYVDTEVAAILADTSAYDTDAEHAAAIWGASTASYNTAGSFGLAIGDAATVSEIVDEWETQSQADPTGFHVNVMEIGGTAQTANDNGADINAILEDTGTTLDDMVDDLETRLTAARAGYLDNLNSLATDEEIADAVWAEDNDNNATEDSYGWTVNMLLNVLAGRMKIDTSANTLTFYDYDDRTTSIRTFYLYNGSRAASHTDVYERDTTTP